MLQFLHGIYAGSLQQLRELGAYAIDTHQVGMVGPCQNQLSTDTSLFLKSLAACGLCTFFEQCIGILDTYSLQLLTIHGTDALNVNNFVVTHNFDFLKG